MVPDGVLKGPDFDARRHVPSPVDEIYGDLLDT